MTWLLDTNVVSEIRRRPGNPRVLRWLDLHVLQSTFLSVVTVGEIQAGIGRLPQGRRKDELQTWFQDEVIDSWADRIIDLDVEVMQAWGRMTAEASGRGQTLPILDSLVAATARVHELTVVTRNARDFVACGVSAENPWEIGAG